MDNSNNAKTFDVVAIPREIWESLVNKIDNLTEIVVNRNRAEFDNEYVDLEGAKKILQHGTRKIEQFRKSGLPYYQWEQGGKIFYKRSDLEAWVEQARKVDSVAAAEPIDIGLEPIPFPEDNEAQED